MLSADERQDLDLICYHPQAILHACLARSQLTLDKFSRWMRSICSILLSKGAESDRSKAIQYFEQASAVLEEHGNLVENGNHVGITSNGHGC